MGMGENNVWLTTSDGVFVLDSQSWVLVTDEKVSLVD